MDLSFFRRAESGFGGRQDVALDYGLLVAMLRAHQDAAVAASAESRQEPVSAIQEPLIEILLGRDQWRQAAVAQQGCFNPAYARQSGVN